MGFFIKTRKKRKIEIHRLMRLLYSIWRRNACVISEINARFLLPLPKCGGASSLLRFHLNFFCASDFAFWLNSLCAHGYFAFWAQYAMRKRLFRLGSIRRFFGLVECSMPRGKTPILSPLNRRKNASILFANGRKNGNKCEVLKRNLNAVHVLCIPSGMVRNNRAQS